MADRRLLSLLGRWHQWRRAYSNEKGYVRAYSPMHLDHEDELEALTMTAMEDAIDTLPAQLQLALQHVARAECLGVEVIMSQRLGTHEQRAATIEQALSRIQKRLLHMGIL